MDNAQASRLPMALRMAKNGWPSEVIGPVAWALVPFDDRPVPPRNLERAVNKRSRELAFELRPLQNDPLRSVAAAMRATNDYIGMAQSVDFPHYVQAWGKLRAQLIAAQSIDGEVQIETPKDSAPYRAVPTRAALGNSSPSKKTLIYSYRKWVKYCQGVATVQGIGSDMFSDLIPAFELADHAPVDLTQIADQIEERFPGRRKWLIDEGVKTEEFEFFWSMPTWVQDFIHQLMNRNLQLEYRSQSEPGLDAEMAMNATLGFIPVFSFEAPSDLMDPCRPLPFELFERVRLHLAEVDTEDFQSEMVRNECFVANDYIRRKIKSGEL
jgi:hypothetical protein